MMEIDTQRFYCIFYCQLGQSFILENKNVKTHVCLRSKFDLKIKVKVNIFFLNISLFFIKSK